MAIVLAKSSLSLRDTSGDLPVVPPPPPPEPRAVRKLRRRINLNVYCRQFLHFSRCKFEGKCKYIHIAFCRWYVTRGCTKKDCQLLHVDICDNWKRGVKCEFLPSCKYLHVGPRERHWDRPVIPAFPVSASSVVLRPNSDLGLRRPHAPELPVQRLVAPLAIADIADQDDEDGVEEIRDIVPAKESQLTAGFVSQFGYQDWGDSGVDADTADEHEEDQSSGEDQPLARLAKVRPRARLAKIAKARPAKPVDVVSSGGERKYVPPVPVVKRPASERSGIQSAPSSDLDYPVRYSWLVTCRRCGSEIMKVFNHRIVSQGKFHYRALRGYWLPKNPENKDNKDTKELFGRGRRADPSKGKSCQVRLPSPGRWDVRRVRDRKKERRILKGKLAKVHFKYHDESECNPEKEDMKFEEKVRLQRLVHLRGEDLGPDADADADEKIDAVDEDDLPLILSCVPCAQESQSKGQKRKEKRKGAKGANAVELVERSFRVFWSHLCTSS